MDSWLIKLGEAQTIPDALRFCREAVCSLGVTRCSYHFIPPFGQPTGKNVIIVQFGFPDAWTAKYQDQAFQGSDPITNFVMKTGRAISWQNAIKAQKLSPEQMDYVEYSQTQGLFDGVGVPLFGPHGRDAYSAFSLSDREIVPEDENLVREIVTIFQAGHRRVCRLLDDQVIKRTSISKREAEVLFWMAHSKSNTDIATILGVSPATVDTLVRRIYAKLKVNDRIAAVVRGLSLGLVKL